MTKRIGSWPVRSSSSSGRCAGRCCTLSLFGLYNSFLLLLVFWLGFFLGLSAAYGTIIVDDVPHLHPANQYLRDNDKVPPEGPPREVDDAGGAWVRSHEDDDDVTLVSGLLLARKVSNE
jgi:hypothetical protein